MFFLIVPEYHETIVQEQEINIVPNPGFELSGGWEFTIPANGAITQVYGGHTGAWAAYLTTPPYFNVTSSTQAILNEILVHGSHYLFTFWFNYFEPIGLPGHKVAIYVIPTVGDANPVAYVELNPKVNSGDPNIAVGRLVTSYLATGDPYQIVLSQPFLFNTWTEISIPFVMPPDWPVAPSPDGDSVISLTNQRKTFYTSTVLFDDFFLGIKPYSHVDPTSISYNSASSVIPTTHSVTPTDVNYSSLPVTTPIYKDYP